ANRLLFRSKKGGDGVKQHPRYVRKPADADFQFSGNHQPSPNAPPKYALSGRNIYDFLDLQVDHASNLAGNRWLTRKHGVFLIAPSGHGKSSFTIQIIISLAIGRTVFGIKPAKPLRILCLQSEDDDMDTKKFVQMIRKMKLTADEIKLLRENTRYEYRNDLIGAPFIKALDDFLTAWPADLVIVNPVTGFFVSNMQDPEKVEVFLRADLNPVLSKHD